MPECLFARLRRCLTRLELPVSAFSASALNISTNCTARRVYLIILPGRTLGRLRRWQLIHLKGFEFTSLHHPSPPDRGLFGEWLIIRAYARDSFPIRERPWTRRTSPLALFRRFWRNLSRCEIARSIGPSGRHAGLLTIFAKDAETRFHCRGDTIRPLSFRVKVTGAQRGTCRIRTVSPCSGCGSGIVRHTPEAGALLGLPY